MRITFILDTFGGGGKERRCLQLIQGLNDAGYKDIQVIIINHKIAYEELYDCKCQIIRINRKERGLSFLETRREIQKHITIFSPDIVQAWSIMSALFIITIYPFHKFNFVASYVADVIKPKFPIGWLTNIICKHICTGIIGNSKAGLKAYKISKKKGVLIYNGFNEKRYETIVDKDKIRRDLDIKTKFVIIQAATFYPIKDWQCYIDAAKIITSKRSDITFLCAGNGPQWEFYNNQINEEERKLIKMIGRRNDIDKIYHICDLSVLCTNIHAKEGLSNTIVESMAFGVPVLATDGGGTPEIITDNINGFIIKEQTPQKLAKQIEEIIENVILRESISKNGLSTIKSKFLLETKTKEYINYYNSLKLNK